MTETSRKRPSENSSDQSSKKINLSESEDVTEKNFILEEEANNIESPLSDSNPVPTQKLILTIIRHGQTDCNVQGIIQGQSVPGKLTEEGKVQAQALGTYFKTFLKPNFDACYCSDLLRTRQTLDEILKNFQDNDDATCQPKFTENSNLFYEKLLRERSFGEQEGCSRTDYEKFKGLPKGAETSKQVGIRGQQFLTNLGDRYLKPSTGGGKSNGETNILIISHGGWIKKFLQVIETGAQNLESTEVQKERTSSFSSSTSDTAPKESTFFKGVVQNSSRTVLEIQYASDVQEKVDEKSTSRNSLSKFQFRTILYNNTDHLAQLNS